MEYVDYLKEYGFEIEDYGGNDVKISALPANLIGLDGKEYTAHSLRHTTASLLLGHGQTLLAVQHVLRHASVNTTQRYTKQKERELRLKDAPEIALDFAF